MRLTLLTAIPARPARRLGVAAACLACTFLGVAVARADLPADGDALVYTGVLEDNGVLVEGTRSIRVELYDVAAGGSPACFAEEQNAELHAGRFRLALPASCAVAARAQAETFVELKVAGATVGRTRVGAVPYALAAGHADHASVAAAVEDGAIGAAALANGAVGNATLGDGSVSAAKLEPGIAISGALRGYRIESANCTDGTGTQYRDCTCQSGERAIGGGGHFGGPDGVLDESTPLGDGTAWRIGCKRLSTGARIPCQAVAVVCAPIVP